MAFVANLSTWGVGLKMGKYMEFCKTGHIWSCLKVWEGGNPTEKDRRARCKTGSGDYIISK